MRIIAKKTLQDFWIKYPETEQSLLSWYKMVKIASWNNFEDVRNQFSSFKIIGSDRIIFKIKGNHYRLIIKISFLNKIVWIRFIGDHQSYDRINAKII